MAPFRAQSTIQLLTIVCLIVGPSTPFKYFVAPVSAIYFVGFWGVHLNAVSCDLAFYEIILQFLQTALLGVFVAYGHQFLILRVYAWKCDFAAVLEHHFEVEGLIIREVEKGQIIFANDQAKFLLTIPIDCDDIQNSLTDTQFEEIGRPGQKNFNQTIDLLLPGQEKNFHVK